MEGDGSDARGGQRGAGGGGGSRESVALLE